MFFPWLGLFEQVRLSDVYVHYDDVQLPQGRSFITRVQLKTPQGSRWLTVPVRHDAKALIKDVRIDETQNWRAKHLATLRHCYARAPYFDEMLAVAERIYGLDTSSLWELNVAGIEEVSRYFGFAPRFVLSSSLATESHGSRKLLDIVELLGGETYVTGLGAMNYLDYDIFESRGVRVEYMQYQRAPYPQLHEPFTASVTILDCIANCGKEGAQYIRSESIYWKDFIDHGQA
jgi:hypothetical protein